jgi:FMN phosphatase YigB (HAD superfamily)
MKYRLVIFDLDFTLLNCGNLYSEVQDILEYLKTNDIVIALASYNAEAECKLRYHGIEDFFQYILYEDWQSRDYLDWKHQMLSEILSLTRIPSDEAVFFDDCEKNLNTAKKLGIKAVEVNPDQGVNMKLIKEILYCENHTSLEVSSVQ